MYDNGEGVPQDKAEAVRWYRLAADQGDAQAQTNLGVKYAMGEGVLQDNVQAHMRGNIGCALGNENGCKFRDYVAAKMTPADVSEAQRRARVCMESDYKDCD
jgi:TPR repeat protein